MEKVKLRLISNLVKILKHVKNYLQPCEGVSNVNDYGDNFVRANVVMLKNVDDIINYDDPDIEKCQEIIFDDFSNKILVYLKENLYSTDQIEPPHCEIYQFIEKRWLKSYDFTKAWEYKFIKSFSDTVGDKKVISSYVQEYIKDYMEHNYLGRDVKVPTVRDVRNWCGGGEFPFLEVYIIRSNRNNIYLAYCLSR